MIFLSASGSVLRQTDIAVTQDVDVNFGQLAYYKITATAPSGTARVRVQSSTGCNTMKMDAFCLRVGGTAKGGTEDYPETPNEITQASSLSVETGTNEFTVNVNPNPVSSNFNVTVKSKDLNTPVEIRILNTNGKLVTIQKTAANSTLKISADKWSGGMYFVEVIQGKQRKVVRLIRM